MIVHVMKGDCCDKREVKGHVLAGRCGWRWEFYLDLAVNKQLFHSFSVSLMQASVMHANSKSQRQLEVGIPHCGNDVLDLQVPSQGNEVYS